MSSIYEHPTLTMRVTPEQRDRAESWLKEAYADGRISELEFDQRIGQVLSAETRRQLNEAFYGLVHVPLPTQALGAHPAYQPVVPQAARDRASRAVGAFAHFSTFFTWLLGPALVYALSSPGTYARREAAKAFNFTLATFVGFVVLQILHGITGLGVFGMLGGLLGLTWFVLTVVAGVKAARGEDWRNPVRSAARLQALPER